MVLLREQLGWGPDRIAALTGVPRSTVHRVIRRRQLQAVRPPREPAVRYEYANPGDMLHVDTKKLGKIVGGPGHRAHGDRTTRARGVGWEVLHMAIDDCTRLVYCEVLADERGRTAAHFLIRALRWFRDHGITVDRILSDNGSPYRSKAWRRVCRAAGVRHRRTRPYRPQTNGKAERFWRTLDTDLIEGTTFDDINQFTNELLEYIVFYNDFRAHQALNGLTPQTFANNLANQKPSAN